MNGRREFVSNGPLTQAAVCSALEACGGNGWLAEGLEVAEDLVDVLAGVVAPVVDVFQLYVSVRPELHAGHWLIACSVAEAA